MTQRHRGGLPANTSAAGAGRGELAAGLATAVIVVELVLAPLVLLGCSLLVTIGLLSRWRPYWLALPAAAGLSWLLETGMRQPVAALAAGPGQALRLLTAIAANPARHAGLAGSLTGSGTWLAGQLPLGLLAASAEAAAVLLLCWRRAAPQWRPGLVAAMRRRLAIAALAAGEVVSRDGFSVGLHEATGRLAGFSWAQAAGGVLVTGPDPAALAGPGLSAACAAIRRRKTVLVLDLAPSAAGGPGAAGRSAGLGLAAGVGELAGRLGIAVSAAGAEAPATAIGRAVRQRGVLLLQARPGPGAAELTADLTGVLASLLDLGLQADCLALITGCEATPPGPLTALLGLGASTGTSLMLLTTSPATAASLWPFSAAAIVGGPVGESLALQLAGSAASSLTGQRSGTISLLARDRASAGRPVAGVPAGRARRTGRGRLAVTEPRAVMVPADGAAVPASVAAAPAVVIAPPIDLARVR